MHPAWAEPTGTTISWQLSTHTHTRTHKNVLKPPHMQTSLCTCINCWANKCPTITIKFFSRERNEDTQADCVHCCGCGLDTLFTPFPPLSLLHTLETIIIQLNNKQTPARQQQQQPSVNRQWVPLPGPSWQLLLLLMLLLLQLQLQLPHDNSNCRLCNGQPAASVLLVVLRAGKSSEMMCQKRLSTTARHSAGTRQGEGKQAPRGTVQHTVHSPAPDLGHCSL